MGDDPFFESRENVERYTAMQLEPVGNKRLLIKNRPDDINKPVMITTQALCAILHASDDVGEDFDTVLCAVMRTAMNDIQTGQPDTLFTACNRDYVAYVKPINEEDTIIIDVAPAMDAV